MRRVFAALVAVLMATTAIWLGACSGHPGSGFGNLGGKDGGAGGSSSGHGPDGSQMMLGTGGGGDGSTSSGPCTGLACQQTCATTTVTGTVYDPANINPLYNVFVYIPNAPLLPIESGPTCTACQAPASGDPIASTSTAADGTFTLTNVPSGPNIPIVLQLGKWRRHLTISNVVSCQTNAQPDHELRLPQKQAESSPDDNIPLIAFTTGCDGAECFFSGRIGLAESEFTGPTGTGRVHVYKSTHDDGQRFPGGSGSADELWQTASEMMKYDIIFDACECAPYNRGGAGSTDIGYVNFLNYLNAGGRVFTTHYFYNFYADVQECQQGILGHFMNAFCEGQAGLPTIGAWEGNQGIPGASSSDCPNDDSLGGAGDAGTGAECLNIDTDVPKGVAFAQWYQANNSKLMNGGGEKYGFVGLTDIREDMGEIASSIVSAGTATPWLYAGDLSGKYDAYYFSFNTPVAQPVASQCGRAIFSDVHLDDAPPAGGSFPNYCPNNPNASSHAPNELALEFLFFDLSSCVQNDMMPPTQPPPPPSLK
jgi:hypothetical protein